MCVVCQVVSTGAAALTGLLPIAVPEAPPEAVAVIERAVDARTSSAPSIIGTACKKVGEVRIVGSQTARCTAAGKKRAWRRVASAATTATTTTTTTTTVPVARLALYQSGGGTPRATVRAPSSASLNTTNNFRVWIYHPEQTDRTYTGASFFMRTLTESWTLYSASVEGFVQLSLAPGQYELDTVEPLGQVSRFTRRMYRVDVAANGAVSISGLAADANGVFAVTVNIRQPTVAFTPRNNCDVQDATGDSNMNNGRPRNPERLTGTGRIRAIIIPVDFADVPGVGSPATIYAPMANSTAEFFRDQSGGKVTFEFQVLEKFVRMPTPSNHFKLGTWSGGDAFGYYRQALDTADPLVDFSLFDVAYVLSPPEIPSSSIAYGPAFPFGTATSDGVINNGTISGADAYMTVAQNGWRWMAHETGHLFGLHDLYRIPAGEESFGAWDLMKDSWTTHAVELTAWHRHVLDWISETAIECIDMRQSKGLSRTLSLGPLTNASTAEKRAAFLRLDEHRVAVLEYRTDSKYDRVSVHAGVLVYIVDQQTRGNKGGWRIIRPSRSVERDFRDATVQIGESVTFNGVTVSVEVLNAAQATVRISTP